MWRASFVPSDGAVDLAERFVVGNLDIKGFGPQSIRQVENWLRTKPRQQRMA